MSSRRFLSLEKVCNDLKKHAEDKNWKQVGRLLSELNYDLAEKSLMHTDDDIRKLDKELHLTRTIFEIGVEYCSLESCRVEAFKRYMAMLKPYYFDYGDQLPDSPKKYEMIGLNLMQLLSENELLKFHTELELLDPQTILNNTFVSFPVGLEQAIQVGNYKKAMEKEVPATSYEKFFEVLRGTIREEIVKGLKMAYNEMSVEFCKDVLNFESSKAGEKLAEDKIASLGVDNRNMVKLPNGVSNDKPQEKDMDEAAKKLAIERAIEYAKEFEKIV